MVGNKEEHFVIQEVIPHPRYTNTSYYNDIGLIKLHRQVNFGPYLRPACLPSPNINQTLLNEVMLSTWEQSSAGTQFVKVRLGRVEQR